MALGSIQTVAYIGPVPFYRKIYLTREYFALDTTLT
jgi:hypothetical protein